VSNIHFGGQWGSEQLRCNHKAMGDHLYPYEHTDTHSTDNASKTHNTL